PVDRAERVAMEAATGTRSIPTLVDGDSVVQGADEIVAYLDARHAEPHDAKRHRAQMRAEWSHWLELEGGGQGSCPAGIRYSRTKPEQTQRARRRDSRSRRRTPGPSSPGWRSGASSRGTC